MVWCSCVLIFLTKVSSILDWLLIVRVLTPNVICMRKFRRQIVLILGYMHLPEVRLYSAFNHKRATAAKCRESLHLRTDATTAVPFRSAVVWLTAFCSGGALMIDTIYMQPVSLCEVCSCPIKFWMPGPVFMKLGKWSHLNGVLHKIPPRVCVCVCVCVCVFVCLVVAR
jgi:hypothetical protein